jgi:hypothetical protein
MDRECHHLLDFMEMGPGNGKELLGMEDSLSAFGMGNRQQ